MGRRLPTFFRESEAEALILAAGNERDRLILRFGMGLGLRVSEITKLEVPDMDLARGMAQIRQAKGDKDRVVPIGDKLVDELRAWIGTRTQGPLFPSPRGGGRLSSRAIQRM